MQCVKERVTKRRTDEKRRMKIRYKSGQMQTRERERERERENPRQVEATHRLNCILYFLKQRGRRDLLE